MNYEPQTLNNVFLLKPKVHQDHRGFFMETFRQSEFEANCGNYQFVQDNHSRSERGTLRGLHYQLKQPQGKLIRVTQGEVYDVIVDCRQGSPTFGQWQGFTLSAENKQLLWVPPGFAHGFVVMSEHADFEYKCTDYYAPDDQYVIAWNDESLCIEWPIEEMKLIMSDNDKNGVCFRDAVKFEMKINE